MLIPLAIIGRTENILYISIIRFSLRRPCYITAYPSWQSESIITMAAAATTAGLRCIL